MDLGAQLRRSGICDIMESCSACFCILCVRLHPRCCPAIAQTASAPGGACWGGMANPSLRQLLQSATGFGQNERLVNAVLGVLADNRVTVRCVWHMLHSG